MAPLSIVLAVVGLVLVAIGWLRFRTPWARYRALQEQDANVARYEAWRGGIRSDSKTGASVAMEILRRQAQVGIAIAVAGVVLLVIAFLVR